MMEEKILSIDIGGTHVKATVLDSEGKILEDYVSVATPAPCTPLTMLKAIEEVTKNLTGYGKISIGFPGYVKDGKVITAPHWDAEAWKDYPLENKIAKLLDKPAKLLNDADLAGLGVVSGKGLELVITLGTGFGTALMKNGILAPHLEMAHHPITNSKTYNDYIGIIALKKIGKKKWNIRIKKVLDIMHTVFNYDKLYIGGGNSKKINFKLAPNIFIVDNQDGISGGAELWKDEKNVKS